MVLTNIFLPALLPTYFVNRSKVSQEDFMAAFRKDMAASQQMSGSLWWAYSG